MGTFEGNVSFFETKKIYKYSRCRSKLGNKLKIKWKIYRFPIGRTIFCYLN